MKKFFTFFLFLFLVTPAVSHAYSASVSGTYVDVTGLTTYARYYVYVKDSTSSNNVDSSNCANNPTSCHENMSFLSDGDYTFVIREPNSNLDACFSSGSYLPACIADPYSVFYFNFNKTGSTLTILVDPVLGCTDPEASNYDPDATEDDGSCTFPVDIFADAPPDTVASWYLGASLVQSLFFRAFVAVVLVGFAFKFIRKQT